MPNVSVSNLDEIKLHLRKELGVLADKLEKSIAKHKTTVSKDASLTIEVKDLDEIKSALAGVIKVLGNFEFNPTINVDVPELKIPEIKVPDMPCPVVQVEAPNVTVTPAPVDLSDLLEALRPLKCLTNKKTQPISVRMSDGQNWVKAVKEVSESIGKFTETVSNPGVVFAGSSGASQDELKAIGLGIGNTVGDGSKTVTASGTAEQLSSTSVKIKKVKVIGLSTNTDTMWVGGSTVEAGRGEPLIALQSTDWIETNDLSNVWIDAAQNGEGVSFIYVA